jgi:hypothetical protein
VLVQQVYGITDPYSSFVSALFVTVMLALGMVGYFFVKEDLLRKNKERAKPRAPSMLTSLVAE